MADMPKPGQKWRFKPNRGSGAFTIIRVAGDRVVIRSAFFGRDKNISLRTLRGDYEKAPNA